MNATRYCEMTLRYQKLRERCKRAARLEKPQVNAKLVAKNTLLLYFRMLAVMLVGLFTSRIQLQALGVSDFGLYQVAMATVSMFCFLSGSLGMASSRFLTVEMGKGTIGSLCQWGQTPWNHGRVVNIFLLWGPHGSSWKFIEFGYAKS